MLRNRQHMMLGLCFWQAARDCSRDGSGVGGLQSALQRWQRLRVRKCVPGRWYAPAGRAAIAPNATTPFLHRLLCFRFRHTNIRCMIRHDSLRNDCRPTAAAQSNGVRSLHRIVNSESTQCHGRGQQHCLWQQLM